MNYQTDKDGILKQYKAYEYSVWCPHCGEEFGVESEINAEREAQHQADMQRVNDVIDRRIAEQMRVNDISVMKLSNAKLKVLYALRAELNK